VENSSIEPAPAALGEGGPSTELKVGVTDRDDGDSPAEIDRQKTAEWNHAGLVGMAAVRTEKLRELNEECGRDAQAANAARRSRPDWHNNGNSAEPPTRRAPSTRPGTTTTNAVRPARESAELVVVGLGPNDRAGPVRDWDQKPRRTS
jgi:hypothetical protein